ncbi:hypothetical protein YC2023_023107 [Brassica napus]
MSYPTLLKSAQLQHDKHQVPQVMHRYCLFTNAQKNNNKNKITQYSACKTKRFENFKILPKLPLVKASLLSLEWYNDAEELEEKVLGGGGNWTNKEGRWRRRGS